MEFYHIVVKVIFFSADSSILILLWWIPLGLPQTRERHDCQRYGFNNCILSTSQSDMDAADFFILHHTGFIGYPKSMRYQLPTRRRQDQRWIWFCLEAPPNYFTNDYDGIFNLTLTYRRDADIFFPYGWLEKIEEKDKNTSAIKANMNATTPQVHRPTMKPPKELAVWVVSHWGEHLARVKYVHRLQPHLSIKIFGSHGERLCRDWTCMKATLSKYKFYLSFENSKFRDYITEKLWHNAFRVGLVPVVLGTTRKNYEDFIPADSFIHVDDFSSPAELAAYLHYLDHNDTAYQAYFNWHTKYILHDYHPLQLSLYERLCHICKHVPHFPAYKTYKSIKQWHLN
uniref:3-galactosyl-N-acetylglucosaminide 4-alpha-L-fucosyltransferase FUT3-like n=1 Tax=Myxine glutinosa TaxID=7769 RepID=UPI00358E5E3B